MSVAESTLTARWIHTTLTGDATITSLVGARVADDPAPAAMAEPLIVFGLLSTNDVATAAGVYRVMTDSLWLIRAIGEGESYEQLAAIATRIDQLFHRAAASVTGGTVFSSTREREHRQSELDQQTGKQYRHLGGEYRVLTQAT